MMMLEKRILNILSTKRNILCNKEKKITIRGFTLVFASILTTIVLIGSCAATKRTLSEKDFFETWSGTWGNIDIPISNLTPQTLFNNPDGTQNLSLRATKIQNPHIHTITLSDQWTDLKGNIWYKADMRCAEQQITMNVYGKIGDSGNTLEYIYHIGSTQIKEWDPDNPLYNYVIYHRQ